MSCPFCDNQQQPSWISCQCPGSNTARATGFKQAWQSYRAALPSTALLVTPPIFNTPSPAETDQPTPPKTPKDAPPLPEKDKPTRDIGDCGPEASACLMDSKSAFSPWNQAILRFSEGIAATNPDLAGWVNRAASAFLAGEPIPKRRPPKVAGKATKARENTI